MLIFLSQFGIIAAGQSGAGDNPETIIVNHVMRVSAVILVTFFLALEIANRKLPNKLNLGTLWPLAFLYLYFMISFMLAEGRSNFNDQLLVVYRSYEWMLCIFLVSLSFPNGDIELVTKKIIDYIKLTIKITIVMVAIYMIFIPDTIYVAREFRSQIGGVAIHANRLSLLCDLGILVFGIYRKNPYDYLWLILCIALTVFTQSRVGILMGVISLYVVFLYKFRAINRIGLSILAVVTGLAIAILILDWFLAGDISQYGQFAQLSTLNSRTEVWSISLSMIGASPLFGWGYIYGPKQIGSFMSGAWYATNAQNDILSALVSGGVLGLFVLGLFYSKLLSTLYKAKKAPGGVFCVVAILLYFITSSFEPFFVHYTVQTSIVMIVIIRFIDLRSRSGRPMAGSGNDTHQRYSAAHLGSAKADQYT
tara:strand:+ start:1739 stop:3004 length:1266 start_codon:yes stop_codon:yes gene_type:complete